MKLTSDLDFGKFAQAKGLILEQTTNPTTAVALLTEIGQIAYIQSTGRPIVRTSSGFSPLAFLSDIVPGSPLTLQRTADLFSADALFTAIARIGYVDSLGRLVVRTSSGLQEVAFTTDTTSGAASLTQNQTFSGVNTFSRAITGLNGIFQRISGELCAYGHLSNIGSNLFGINTYSSFTGVAFMGHLAFQRISDYSEFARITSSGELLLGQTNSAGARLQVTGNSLFNGRVGIGTATPHVSALAEIASTSQGFLPPRMTTAQKNAIASPAAGLVVFDTTLAKLCVFTTIWETIQSS